MVAIAKRIRANAALWIFLGTFIALALHPIPECVACEYPNPWGRNDAAYARDSAIFVVWLLSTSFVAGAFRIKRSWLVPVSIVVADLGTQPIGGVAVSSLLRNEGPMILLFGLVAGGTSLGLGWLTRTAIDALRRKALTKQGLGSA
jgi:hypothetical protein